jgi:flagellar motor switch protein FliN/FliY
MMMMALDSNQTSDLNQLLNTFFDKGAKGMGMMMGVDLELQSFKSLLNAQWLDLPERFESDAPIIGLSQLKGATTEPIVLFLKSNQGLILADLMLGGAGVPTDDPLSDMQVSALGEALNQMISGAVQGVNPQLKTPLAMAHTEAHIQDNENLINYTKPFQRAPFYSIQGTWLLNDHSGLNESIDFVALLSESFAENLVALLAPPQGNTVTPTKDVATTTGASSGIAEAVQGIDAQATPAYASVGAIAQEQGVGQASVQQAGSAHPMPYGGIPSSGTPANQQNGILSGSYTGNSSGTSAPKAPNAGTHVQPIHYGTFDVNTPSIQGDQQENMSLLMDINLNLHVELGRSHLSIKIILELTRGSVVELDRVAGEAVDLYANGKLIARGEVVVIEDNFGLRVTSIVSPADRLKGL